MARLDRALDRAVDKAEARAKRAEKQVANLRKSEGERDRELGCGAAIFVAAGSVVGAWLIHDASVGNTVDTLVWATAVVVSTAILAATYYKVRVRELDAAHRKLLLDANRASETRQHTLELARLQAALPAPKVEQRPQ